MMQFMNQLTDKPDWHRKIFDETSLSRWEVEALATDETKTFEKTGAISVYDGNVVQFDLAIPKSVKEALQIAAARLEQVPEKAKDWHPESDEKVLDPVHPSLFPLVYGLRRILPVDLVALHDCIERSGEGKTIPVPSEMECYLGEQL
ncbi:putative protein of unknown function (DUF4246) [Lyophyllum shimeji]|uniref:Uncharacterized protein n=1 Tax=Lyophyllum shimeji TaxID=47721 RepID=A0A9P3UTF8_LYOSH|nr:putative protein of unknown function (DUF4246) [Lyophyllum shimeji]